MLDSPDVAAEAVEPRWQTLLRWLQHGDSALEVAARNTDLNDRLVAGVLASLQRQLGPPPVPYCWLGLGSSGRREQSLKTDLDSAIVYRDVEPEQADRVAHYFGDLTDRAVSQLERLGLPRCPGEVSAANPRWCQPITVWRRYFSEWVNHPQPQALLNCAIFFDLRPIVGHHELAEQLWSDLERWLPRATFFTKMLLRESLVHRPPLGLFGRLTVEKTGPHAGAFDLKWRGVMPIVEPARVYALAHGLRLTNTVERLRTLASLGELSHTDGDDLVEAYQFLMRLRLQHHLEQASSGQEPDDFIVPAQLPAEQRETLRRHFKIVARLQEFVEHQVLAGLVR